MTPLLQGACRGQLNSVLHLPRHHWTAITIIHVNRRDYSDPNFITELTSCSETECWEQRSLYPWSAADKDEPFSDITGAASVNKPFTFLIVTFLLHIVLTIMLFPTLNDIYDLRTKVIHDLINASKYKAMSNKWKQINEVTGEVTHVYQWNILQAITSTVKMSHL